MKKKRIEKNKMNEPTAKSIRKFVRLYLISMSNLLNIISHKNSYMSIVVFITFLHTELDISTPSIIGMSSTERNSAQVKLSFIIHQHHQH